MIRLYCYIPRQDLPAQDHIARDLRRALTSPQVELITNDQATTDIPSLTDIDVLVVEASQDDRHIGFLLAHAIVMKKPVLYLFPKGMRPLLFDHVAPSHLPSGISVVGYARGRIEQAIQPMMEKLTGQATKEIPRIKFTLRVTPSIDSYLDYKSDQAKVTKADFLRQHIERVMKDDQDWSAKKSGV